MSNNIMAEFTVTEWPSSGEPKVVAGPYNQPIHIGDRPNGAASYCSIPMREPAWAQLTVELTQLVPAQPGWVAATARLSSANGTQLGAQRPVCFYGRKSDTGTYLYFAEAHLDASYSVQIRIVSGGVDE